MSTATVQEFGRSKAGNPKIKLDGKWYPVGRNNIDGIQPGSQVEVEYSTFRGQDGKDVPCIGTIRPLGSSSPAPSRSNGNGHAQPQPAPQQKLPPYDEAELRFISNVVGSAIMAKTIDKPEQISLWTRGASNALKALKNPDAVFDDDIPETFYQSENPAPTGNTW